MIAKGINFRVSGNQILSVTEFALSGTSWSSEKTTNHDNTTPVETFVPTIRNDGDITLTINPYDANNTQHALLRSMSVSGNSGTFKITYPGSQLGSFSFTGYVTSFAYETPVDGELKAKVKITPSGAIGDIAASVLSLAVTDNHAESYETADVITLQATLDELVYVTGTPRIAIALTSGTVYANYASGTGTTKLNFAYTVQSGDSCTPELCTQMERAAEADVGFEVVEREPVTR